MHSPISRPETPIRMLLVWTIGQLKSYTPRRLNVFVTIIWVRVSIARPIGQPNDEIDTPRRMVPEHPKVWSVVGARWKIIHRESRPQSEGVVYRFHVVAGPIADNFLEAAIEPEKLLRHSKRKVRKITNHCIASEVIEEKF